MGVLFFWPLDPLFCHYKVLVLDSSYTENHLSYCNELASEEAGCHSNEHRHKQYYITLNVHLNQKTHKGVTQSIERKNKDGKHIHIVDKRLEYLLII